MRRCVSLCFPEPGVDLLLPVIAPLSTFILHLAPFLFPIIPLTAVHDLHLACSCSFPMSTNRTVSVVDLVPACNSLSCGTCSLQVPIPVLVAVFCPAPGVALIPVCSSSLPSSRLAWLAGHTPLCLGSHMAVPLILRLRRCWSLEVSTHH